MLDGIYREMVQHWEKPIVKRSEVSEFSFGLLNSPSYMANLDSQKMGPPKDSVGSKVFYRKEDLAKWMQERNQQTVQPVKYLATNGSKNFTMEVYADYLFIGEDEQKKKKIQIKEDVEELLGSADGIVEIFEKYFGRMSFIYDANTGDHILGIFASEDN